MSTIPIETLRQLDALNKWLGDVFGEGIRISTLLSEAGLADSEIATIKAMYLVQFLHDVVEQLLDTNTTHDGERNTKVMIRRYGLLDGKPETLQSIGDSLQLSRERIRQLVNNRIRIYRTTKRKNLFRSQVVAIARKLLHEGDSNSEESNVQ